MASIKVYPILGRRSLGWNSNSVFGDCANYLDTTQNNINAVAVGTTYYIRSSNAADAAAGTGARTVRIVYLDAAGVLQVVTATLNGVTAVSLGTGFTFFEWMETATAGSGGVAAGDITIATASGAGDPTVAQTVAKITAGGNRSLDGAFQVPSDSHAYVHRWAASAIGAAMDARLRATVFADDRVISPGVLHFQSNAYLAASVALEVEINGAEGLFFPSSAVIKVSCIPAQAQAGNRLDANFFVTVVKLP